MANHLQILFVMYQARGQTQKGAFPFKEYLNPSACFWVISLLRILSNRLRCFNLDPAQRLGHGKIKKRAAVPGNLLHAQSGHGGLQEQYCQCSVRRSGVLVQSWCDGD
jgi:hypothetical protein